jgi:hypothetical protein
MTLYDLTHVNINSSCPKLDKNGVEIPSVVRESIDKIRTIREKDRMLADIADALKGVKAALKLCQTDVRYMTEQSKEVTELKLAIFSKLDFAALSLSNWKNKK